MDINAEIIEEAQQSAVEDFGMTLITANPTPPVVGMSGILTINDKFGRRVSADATYFDERFHFLGESGQHVFLNVTDDEGRSATVRLDRSQFLRLHSFLGVILDGTSE